MRLCGGGSRFFLCGSRGWSSVQGAKSPEDTTTLTHRKLSAVRTAAEAIPVWGGRLNSMIFDILSNSQLLGRLYLLSNHDFSLSLRLQKTGAQPQTLRSYENIPRSHGVISQDHTRAATPIGQCIDLPAVSEGGGQVGAEPVVIGWRKAEWVINVIHHFLKYLEATYSQWDHRIKSGRGLSLRSFVIETNRVSPRKACPLG